jgi:hypothetical protein
VDKDAGPGHRSGLKTARLESAFKNFCKLIYFIHIHINSRRYFFKLSFSKTKRPNESDRSLEKAGLSGQKINI